MCTVINSCGCGHTSSPIGLAAAARVAWRAATLLGRWLSGAPLWGPRHRPATFLHAGYPPPSTRRVRVNWAYWPGWQRAATRWVLTAAIVAAITWPTTTAIVAATVLAAAGSAATRHAMTRRRSRTVRVRAYLGSSPQPPSLAATQTHPVHTFRPTPTREETR